MNVRKRLVLKIAVSILFFTLSYNLFAQSEPFEGLNSYILKAMK